MAYDRFGMDVTAAVALTGDTSLVDADLEAGETDLVDLILGYRPSWYDPTPANPLERDLAFGRAVAWQASHRGGLADADLDPGVELASQSFPDASESYVAGRGPRGPSRIAPNAYYALRTHGWLHTVGYTHGGTESPRDPWHPIG